jgi:hypothetical protein
MPLSVTVTTPADANGRPATGAKIAVDTSKITVMGGTAAAVTLTISGVVPPPDEYTGTVIVSGTGVAIRLPYLFLVPSGVVNDLQAIQFGQIDEFAQGSFETVPNGDAGALQIKLIDASGVPVANAPVSFSVSPPGSATLKSVGVSEKCGGGARSGDPQEGQGPGQGEASAKPIR